MTRILLAAALLAAFPALAQADPSFGWRPIDGPHAARRALLARTTATHTVRSEKTGEVVTVRVHERRWVDRPLPDRMLYGAFPYSSRPAYAGRYGGYHLHQHYFQHGGGYHGRRW